MCDLKVCRICLRMECKFYKYDQIPLKFYYEEVMCFKGEGRDHLPQYFCYECATLLHKFHKFKEKCFNGQNILQDLHIKNALNYEEVHELYRLNEFQPALAMNLSVMKMSEHVKIYYYKYNGDDDKIEIDIPNNSNLGTDDYDLDETAGKHNDFLKDVIDENELNVVNDVKNASGNPKPDLDENDHDYDDFFVEIPNLNDIGQIESESVQNPQYNLNTRIPSQISFDDEVLAEDKNAVVFEQDAKNVPKFQRSKEGPILSDVNWKKYNLTDEEAMQRFEAKASDSNYINASHKCTQCYRWFSNADIYDRHKVMRHNQALPLECKFCKMRFKLNPQLHSHLQPHYKVFECQRCNFVCHMEQTAIFHDEKHNVKKIIRTCKVCNKGFRHSSTYYGHMMTHRTNFVCTTCGRSFISESGLVIHKKRSHTQRLDLANEMRIRSQGDPESVLSTPLQAMRHVRISNNIPTNCSQCDKHFVSQKECREHLLKEHSWSGALPGKSERTICEICGADLALTSLSNHMKMHSRREKRYKCDLCQKRFVQKETHKIHMLGHTGEKHFACTMCEKKFTQPASLGVHIKTVHFKLPPRIRNRRKKTKLISEEDRTAE